MDATTPEPASCRRPLLPIDPANAPVAKFVRACAGRGVNDCGATAGMRDKQRVPHSLSRILSAIPIAHRRLFDALRHETRRCRLPFRNNSTLGC
jgi:hypothetical protein